MKKEVKYSSINIKNNIKFNKQFLVAYFKITSECMLCCPFCSQGKNAKRTIHIDDAKIVLDKLKKIGIKTITYTGGEPLIFEYLKQLLEYGKSLGFEQIIVTNGILLNEIDSVLFQYINGIGISLHGTENIHDKVVAKKGIYKQVESNIDYVLRKYPNIVLNINCTLTKDNSDYNNMKYLTDFAKKRNIRLCFGRLNYIGLSETKNIVNPDEYLSNIYKLSEEYNKIEISNCISLCNQKSKYNYLNHSCGAGQTMLAIEPNGDVKICASSNIVLGNILQDKLRKIINNKKLKEYRNLKWLPMECKNCKKFAMCKGGCHAEGSGNFYNDNCDALLLNKYETIWQQIKDKNLKFKNSYFVKKRVNKYLIINRPVREINKTGIDIIKELDGTKTIYELAKEFNNISNFKEFMILLYIDGMLV